MSDYKDNINNTSKKEEIDALYMPSTFVRLINYTIDSIVIIVIMALLGIVLGIDYSKYTDSQSLNDSIGVIQYLILAISFLYYTILESAFGKTLGKVITKTNVVDIYGNKPRVLTIMLRSIVRLIPFAALVIFFTNSRTLHDMLSKTYVIVDE